MTPSIKKGAFDKDLDYERTILGSGAVVKGLECAMVGMSAGAVRQVVVPFQRDLSYPLDDLDHVRVGPKPSTFSGQRALNFVLENPRIDRTLLFNVKIIRVDKPNGKGGGFVRG
jgi:FKBP-type peptidyl-prolyl cis-trans isomerase